MNIFLTDYDPKLSAIALDNKRLNKMVLETAQLLSTACHVLLLDTDLDGIYKETHTNHPCAKFARHSYANFTWLTEHGYHLAQEFKHRFSYEHASLEAIRLCYSFIVRGPCNDPSFYRNDLDFNFNCSGYDTGDLTEDYKLCMSDKWVNDENPRWTNRGKPLWFKDLDYSIG